MKKREAVYLAIRMLGSLTSVDTLHREAQRVYGGKISRGTVLNYRLDWRNANGKKEDSRTHRTQFRRDQRDDAQWNAKSTKAVSKHVSKPRAFLNVLADFHSIDQLRNAVEQMARFEEFRKAA